MTLPTLAIRVIDIGGGGTGELETTITDGEEVPLFIEVFRTGREH